MNTRPTHGIKKPSRRHRATKNTGYLKNTLPKLLDSAFNRLSLAILTGALFGVLFHSNTVLGNVMKVCCLSGAFISLHRSTQWREALLTSWAWGATATLTGMGWLYVAMHDIGGLPVWLTSIALLLFSLLLGAFNGVAGMVFERFTRYTNHRILAFSATWVIGEWLRTWLLTGMPWMNVGYAFVDTPWIGVASSLGVLGVGAAATSLAAGIAYLLSGETLRPRNKAKAFQISEIMWALKTRKTADLFSINIVVILFCYFAGQTSYTQPHGQPITVALLQGNVPQNLKFDPAASLKYMALYADMAANSTAQLTFMPETALPSTLENLPLNIITKLKNTPNTLVIGNLGKIDNKYTNRLEAPFIKNAWQYEKNHLVPFGETVPIGFQWFVNMMDIPLSSLERGGNQQPNLEVAGVSIAANICYEELFAHEWRNRAASAHVLLNASNFGWYGRSTVLPQHINIARMRALEFQKPYLSATNNGTTLTVDSTGDINLAPINTTFTLNALVQGMAGITPYAIWGDWGIIILVLGLLAWALVKTKQ